jgi:hypothetical protein
LVSDCRYGIYRLGDDQTIPSRMAVSAYGLEHNAAELVHNKTVTVLIFEILKNVQADLKKSLAGLGNPGGCTDAFLLDRNPDNNPAIIVLFELEIDGRMESEKVVQLEPNRGGRQGVTSDAIEARLKNGIESAIEKIIGDFKRGGEGG